MKAKISHGFWQDRLEVNADRAIFHQWKQLEASGSIENFRIAAGERDGFREGWFFADSDAYKWLEAASRIYALQPDLKLASVMDGFISLIARTQQPDGYIFTYNQLHFPNQRWVNLQVEHELYCHGHLIEAGVSHFEATSRHDLLDICIKAAELLVCDFLNASNDKTCGHEEIEIALIRLYRVTGNENYLELARQFVERRGRIPFFPVHMLNQFMSGNKRGEYVQILRKAYIAEHPEHKSFQVPKGNFSKKPPYITARWYANALFGLYAQQHAPIRRQTKPVGHSVRFGYLETAVAMLCRSRSDWQSDLPPILEQAWARMVKRRMYVTGGLGSLPALEGFGVDYELDPEYAYSETCASLASLFWNWEMTLLTSRAQYSDLFEWQLYNATNVGMGQTGETYLYNNPLEVHGGVTRREWYAVPCCPSNLSRTFADLGKYIFSYDENEIWIHQYMCGQATMNGVKIKIESGLPWNGRVRIFVKPEATQEFTLHLRKPSWAVKAQCEATASGYDPAQAEYEAVSRVWSKAGEMLEFDFGTSLQLRHAHPKVKGHAGKVAVTRGPLVYCLESVDNPEVDIFAVQLDGDSLRDELVPDLLGGCVVIQGRSRDGKSLKFIPYFLWANRGESQMTVWVKIQPPKS